MGSKSKYTANEVVKELFMDWLNYPNAEARKKAGLPATKSCFALRHGISRSQLWRYEKDFDFQRERMESISGIITPDDWRAIMLAQKQNALNGNLNAAKWLDEKLGLSGPTLVDEKEDDFEREMKGWSDEQLEAYLAEHGDE